jgi:hypothetical protein
MPSVRDATILLAAAATLSESQAVSMNTPPEQDVCSSQHKALYVPLTRNGGHLLLACSDMNSDAGNASAFTAGEQTNF